jgi:hypothetical protein
VLVDLNLVPELLNSVPDIQNFYYVLDSRVLLNIFEFRTPTKYMYYTVVILNLVYSCTTRVQYTIVVNFLRMPFLLLKIPVYDGLF